LPAVALLILSGCTTQAWCDRFNLDCDPTEDLVHQAPADSDGDVWPDEDDCAPDNAAINPSAEELCDGADNDCDGQVDEGTPGVQTWYRDRDGDGYGDDDTTVEGCEASDGYILLGGDCDDLDRDIHPGRDEVCGNGIDDDCSGDAPECPYANLSSSDDALSSFVPVNADGVIGDTLSVSPGTLGDQGLHVVYGSPLDTRGGAQVGAVYLALGTYAALSSARDGVRTVQLLSSLDEGDGVGSAIAADMDVDGDGDYDVVVGAPGAEATETDEGLACLLLSHFDDFNLLLEYNCAVQLAGGREGAAFGSALATVHDETRWPDAALAVGSPGDAGGAGSAALFAPPLSDGQEAGDAFLTVEGSVEGGALGSSMTSADLDGDGIDDLVLAAPAAAGGEVVIGFGPVPRGIVDADDLGAVLEGITEGDRAGFALDARGDLDGDGRVDLLVGAPGAADGHGAVYALRGGDTLHRHTGRVTLDIADARFEGTHDGGAAGWSVASGGDFDDDGQTDVLIGAPGDVASPSTDTASGSVWIVYSGLLGTVYLDDDTIRVLGAAGVQEFGTSLGVAQGEGGDSLDGFFVGAPGGTSPAMYFFPGAGY